MNEGAMPNSVINNDVELRGKYWSSRRWERHKSSRQPIFGRKKLPEEWRTWPSSSRPFSPACEIDDRTASSRARSKSSSIRLSSAKFGPVIKALARKVKSYSALRGSRRSGASLTTALPTTALHVVGSQALRRSASLHCRIANRRLVDPCATNEFRSPTVDPAVSSPAQDDIATRRRDLPPSYRSKRYETEASQQGSDSVKYPP